MGHYFLDIQYVSIFTVVIVILIRKTMNNNTRFIYFIIIIIIILFISTDKYIFIYAKTLYVSLFVLDIRIYKQ